MCKNTFDSRTKLFTHIRETGHAIAEPAGEPHAQGKKGWKSKR